MTASGEAGPWGEAQQALDTDLIELIHAGNQKQTDIEVAVPLAHLVHDEYEGYGTGGKEQISNLEARGALAALRAATARLAVPFDPPFTDFGSFETYWKRNGGYGNYQARRDMLVTLFEPLHERLADLESGSLRSVLAEAVSPRPRTGWVRVDEEIAELRRHFQVARSPQDYSNIGNDCIAVLEALSAAAYAAVRHLPPGEEEPSVANTKARLEAVVTVEMPGADNARLRKLARAAIEQAQDVKHSRTSPNRRTAGIAADSVILLSNIMRRLHEPPF